MLSTWFNRKRKKSGTSELDVRSQRPTAGEVRRQGLDEVLFLAPLPVPTGQAQSGRRNFSAMNEVYLEIGSSNMGMVWQGKLLAFGIWLILLITFGFPALTVTYLHSFYPENYPSFWGSFINAMEVFSLAGLFSLLPIGAFCAGILSSVRALAKQYPLRFNRQRREVCYIDSETHRVSIVPWESVVAWVARSQGVTQYGATRQHTFGLGLEDAEQDRVHFVMLQQPSDAHALGLWTAIRNYMEEGPLVDTPNPMLKLLGLTPTEDELKPYEGLHTWDIEKRQARLMGFLDDGGEDLSDEERESYGYSKRTYWPLRRWYIWRILTFWKMPYLLAEWSHRVGRPTLPEQVKQWSQPLPPEQWAKPSAALRQASKTVQAALEKGASFNDACKAAGLCRAV